MSGNLFTDLRIFSSLKKSSFRFVLNYKTIIVEVVSLCNGMSAFVAYLMPNPSL